MESAGFVGSSTGNFTIDYLLSLLCVLSTECQIYILNVENVLRDAQDEVISLPAVTLILTLIIVPINATSIETTIEPSKEEKSLKTVACVRRLKCH